MKQALVARERFARSLNAVQSKLAGARAQIELLEADANPEHAKNLLDQYEVRSISI